MQQNSQRQPQPYAPDELFHLWETGKITLEQVCGQLIVWNQQLNGRLLSQERDREDIHHELADLNARLEEIEKGK